MEAAFVCVLQVYSFSRFLILLSLIKTRSAKAKKHIVILRASLCVASLERGRVEGEG